MGQTTLKSFGFNPFEYAGVKGMDEVEFSKYCKAKMSNYEKEKKSSD